MFSLSHQGSILARYVDKSFDSLLESTVRNTKLALEGSCSTAVRHLVLTVATRLHCQCWSCLVDFGLSMHVSMMGIFHTKSSGSLFTSSTFFTKFQNKKGSRKPATRLLVCVVMQTDLFLKLKKEPPRNGWTARQQAAHNTHTWIKRWWCEISFGVPFKPKKLFFFLGRDAEALNKFKNEGRCFKDAHTIFPLDSATFSIQNEPWTYYLFHVFVLFFLNPVCVPPQVCVHPSVLYSFRNSTSRKRVSSLSVFPSVCSSPLKERCKQLIVPHSTSYKTQLQT